MSKNSKSGNNLQLGLKVSNLKEAVSELDKSGVKFLENGEDQVQLASFTDPDDNILYLIQSNW